MPVRDHQPLTQEDFHGLFSRGRLLPNTPYVGAEPTPKDHFIDCLNLRYLYNGVGSREGSVLDLTFTGIGNVQRFFLYKIEGQATRYIILTNDGTNSYLYDSTNMAAAIYIWPNLIVPDISIQSLYGRCYITPHDDNRGLPGQYVLVYSGSGMARFAAGATPLTGPLGVIAHDPTKTDYDGQGGGGAPTTNDVGNVQAGYRLFGYCFETDSGFITAPGPNNGSVPNLVFAPTLYKVNDSGHKVDLYNIPVGPAGTIARRLVCTPVILNPDKVITNGLFTGKPQDQPWFFVPNGRLPNNTIVGTQATPAITVNFFETDLQSSAQYLFFQLALIPAGCAFFSYSNRLLVFGQNANDSVVLASQPQQPESFDSINGNIVVDPGDAGGGCHVGLDYQGVMHIFKSQRNYVTQDPQNGTPPINWPVTGVEYGIGAECFGVATVLDAKGAHANRMIIADRSGILQFAGAFAQKPITWNCDDIWKRINFNVFNTIQIAIDPVLFRIYIALPLDGATTPNFILYGDYAQGQQSSPYAPTGGITPEIIKWCLWQFPANVKSIVVDVDPTSKYPIFKFVQGNNIYHLSPATNPTRDDYGNILSGFGLSELKTLDKEGMINHFGEVRMRVYGSGRLMLAVSNEDQTLSITPNFLTLSTTPGKDLSRILNFQSERAMFKFSFGNALDDWFHMNLLTVYAKPLWAIRNE